MLALRQAGAGDRSNGIPAVRRLSGDLDVTGRVVTMDAMRARHGTARGLPARRADHPVTAAGDSQETIHDDPGAVDLTGAPSHGTAARGHGRPGRRRCGVVDLTGAERDGRSALHGCRQAIRAGPGTRRARGPAGLVRNHWTIGNRVRHLRDLTCDGDRCRAHVRNPPRSLSRLTDAAIAIVRCDGRFGYMPEASRHRSGRAKGTRNAPSDGAAGQPCPDTENRVRKAQDGRQPPSQPVRRWLEPPGHARLPSRQAPEPENKMVLCVGFSALILASVSRIDGTFSSRNQLQTRTKRVRNQSAVAI